MEEEKNIVLSSSAHNNSGSIPGGESANELLKRISSVPGAIRPKKGLAGDLPRVCFLDGEKVPPCAYVIDSSQQHQPKEYKIGENGLR